MKEKKKRGKSPRYEYGETYIRGNWRPLARDHAQFRPNKTRVSLHPVIHTHVHTRPRRGLFVRACAFLYFPGRSRREIGPAVCPLLPLALSCVRSRRLKNNIAGFI